ncbi:hypothetical protein CC80DRAFT_488321 [Byssothecium circinans]|uniref:C2H2-type domain-containing protein n=1 Tax=Byssothecium circinans TaxID=147558 RepID=A0A6A5UDB3_9PLEO|nr:hypothetical protein CC80DRAFT_488321 [Byssothecium circinans]
MPNHPQLQPKLSNVHRLRTCASTTEPLPCTQNTKRKRDDRPRKGTKRSKASKVNGQPRTGYKDGPTKDESPRVGCPFYIQNPTQYHGTLSCRGAGFKEVAKLKDHLKDVHRVPQEVLKRDLNFKTTEFLRLESIDGKWKLVYRKLFPTTPVDEIPSPRNPVCQDTQSYVHIDEVRLKLYGELCTLFKKSNTIHINDLMKAFGSILDATVADPNSLDFAIKNGTVVEKTDWKNQNLVVKDDIVMEDVDTKPFIPASDCKQDVNAPLPTALIPPPTSPDLDKGTQTKMKMPLDEPTEDVKFNHVSPSASAGASEPGTSENTTGLPLDSSNIPTSVGPGHFATQSETKPDNTSSVYHDASCDNALERAQSPMDVGPYTQELGSNDSVMTDTGDFSLFSDDWKHDPMLSGNTPEALSEFSPSPLMGDGNYGYTDNGFTNYNAFGNFDSSDIEAWWQKLDNNAPQDDGFNMEPYIHSDFL